MFNLIDQNGKGVISVRQFKNFLNTTSFLDVVECFDMDYLASSLNELSDDEFLTWDEFEEV